MIYANKTNPAPLGETASKILRLSEESRKLLKPADLKILVFDIERFPLTGHSWGPKWETSIIEVTEPAIICSIAWQWYPRREKFVLALSDFPGYNHVIRDDSRLISAFAREFNACDLGVGHNIVEFDNKVIRTEALKAKMTPTRPILTFDTLKVCREQFKFPSNKLEDICVELGIGKKVKHQGWPLWKACMAGDLNAFRLMKLYNLGDVDPLARGLYERVKPWAPHPNLNLTDGNVGCPHCRSKNYKAEGHAYTKTTMSQRFQCHEPKCGRWFQGRPVIRKNPETGVRETLTWKMA